MAATLKRGGQELWQCVLGTEWGGMNEVARLCYLSSRLSPLASRLSPRSPQSSLLPRAPQINLPAWVFCTCWRADFGVPGDAHPRQVMYNLYDVTGTEAYLSTGLKFNHWQWTAPLAIGDDGGCAIVHAANMDCSLTRWP